MEPAGLPATCAQKYATHIAHIDTESIFDHNSQSAKDMLYVFYSHSDSDETAEELDLWAHQAGAIELCDNFDTLLTLLEDDCVDGIVFDRSVAQQEIQYISRWANIFKPSIRCYEIGTNRRRGNAAFIASPQF